MASRVLLISANTCTDPYPVFPLGLAQVNAALRQAGHVTRWFDLQSDGPSVAATLAEFAPDYVGISLRNIDDVLIKKRETFYGALVSLCREIRAHSRAAVILGGSGFSIFPRELLALSGAEYGIHGEGEHSVVALLEALERGADSSAVPGLVFRRNGEVQSNPQPGRPTNGLMPAERPTAAVDFYLRRSGMLNVQTQRGCAHSCCYCTYPVLEGARVRRRDPEAVAEELVDLERRGARYFLVVDSIFNSSAEHVAAFCETVLRRGLKMRWGCFMRPSRLTPDLVRLAARAGLAHIEFGADSFSDPVLAAYQKGFTFDDILQATELVRNEKIDCCHFLICGGPGETPATLEETFANSRRLKGAVILALVGMRIYPGTALHAQAQREGRLPANADLLAPQYYLALGLDEAAVFGQLQRFAQELPQWIVGDPPPRYLEMARRLRERGVVGPLWGYIAMMQRLGPPPGRARV